MNNKNTKVIYSISSKPGKFGVTLYNYLFNKYSLPFLYKPVAVNSKSSFYRIIDLFEDTDMFYALSISMPFKKIAYDYLSSKKNFSTFPNNIFSLNSLKKNGNNIVGALTDYFIFEEFKKKLTPNINEIIIYGNGAISKLASDFFIKRKYKCSILPKDNLKKSIDLFSKKNNIAFVNATPVKLENHMSIKKNKYPVLDFPVQIPIEDSNPYFFSGYWATKIQFIHQFKFYFGINLELNEIDSICYQLF